MAWGPRIPASQVEPGDLVFFAGSDGTTASPGHVGLVIGKGMMIEAYATGFPIRISSYGTARAAAGTGSRWASPGPGRTPASSCPTSKPPRNPAAPPDSSATRPAA